MNAMIRNRALLLIVIFSLGLAGNAIADSGDKKEREALRKMRLMMQTFEQEKSALQQENNSLNEKVKALGSQVGDIKSASTSQIRKKDARLGEAEKELVTVRQENLSLVAKLQGAQQSLEELTLKHKEVVQAAQISLQYGVKQGEESNNKIKEAEAKIAQQSQAIDMCEKKNLVLYELNVEILDKYKSKGVWGAFIQTEPFTQIKRVEIENTLQEYKDKLDSQKMEKSGLGKGGY
ncbi:MAG: hypothetical protein M3A44_05840 [Gammaproteobacteria bacterium]